LARVYERRSSFGVGNLKVFEIFTQQKDGAIFGAIFEELSFFCFCFGGKPSTSCEIYSYSSKTEHLQKILYGFKFRRHQLYVQPLSRLFLRRFDSKALAVDVQLSRKKLQTAKLPNQGSTKTSNCCKFNGVTHRG